MTAPLRPQSAEQSYPNDAIAALRNYYDECPCEHSTLNAHPGDKPKRCDFCEAAEAVLDKAAKENAAAYARAAAPPRFPYCENHQWLTGHDATDICPQCMVAKFVSNIERLQAEIDTMRAAAPAAPLRPCPPPDCEYLQDIATAVMDSRDDDEDDGAASLSESERIGHLAIAMRDASNRIRQWAEEQGRNGILTTNDQSPFWSEYEASRKAFYESLDKAAR